MEAWEQQFIEEVEAHHGTSAATVAGEIVEGVHDRGLRTVMEDNVETKGIGLQVVVPRISWDPTPAVAFGKLGTIGWEIGHMRHHQPFQVQEMEQQLRQRLAAIPGMDLDYPDYPKAKFSAMTEGDAATTVLDVLDWTVARIRAVNQG
jgi:hypothetical protein